MSAPRPIALRDLAKKAVLDLAQAELTKTSTPEMCEAAAQAMADVGIGSDMFRSFVSRGMVQVRELLDVAMRLTELGVCSCGITITGHDWRRWHYVGLQRSTDGKELLELRNCPLCGTTRSVRVPNEKERKACDSEQASSTSTPT